MCDNFRERKVGRFHVKVAFYNLQIWRDTPEKFVCLFVRYVSEAEDLANLSGGQELLELVTGAISTDLCIAFTYGFVSERVSAYL